MTKRDWIYGGIIAVLFVTIGLTIGITYRKSKEWKIELKDQTQQMEELDKLLDITEEKFEQAQKTADAASEERDALSKDKAKLKTQLAASRSKLRNRPTPATFEECKKDLVDYQEYTDGLEGTVSLLEKELQLAGVEIFSLRDVIREKNFYIETVEDKLLVQKDMNKIYKRMSKKDKRVKIWSNVLSGSVGLVLGVGVGKVSN